MDSDPGRPWLADGETIAAQTVVAAPAGLTISGITAASGVVRWQVSGGTSGQIYTLTVTVTSSTGRRAERSIRLPVRDL